MNVLFAMYGDFATNSAIPMALHARELQSRGHDCVAAVPSNVESASVLLPSGFRPALYGDVLADPPGVFGDGRAADIVHAWTSREGVRRFVTAYLAKRPTPWIIYLEDNEGWISRAALRMVGIHESVLLQHPEEIISAWTPDGLSHALRYESFIGLADGAVVVQDKLASEVPPWVPRATVMNPVDLEFFAPRAPEPALRERYGVRPDERVIVYPGGVNDFTRPGLEALCQAVGLINRAGVPCRLLRSGPFPLGFELPADATVSDLGALPRRDMPGLLALADVFVQPGKPDPYEDLRLPGKLPEMFATGRPVVLPDANIASLLEDGVNAVIHRTGSPEEIAQKCLELFADQDRARKIGEAGRAFAEEHFDPARQAARLEGFYRESLDRFDLELARRVWGGESGDSAVGTLLARKLRLLAGTSASRAIEPGALLEALARRVNFTIERSGDLEKGIAVRDHEIGQLKQELEARGRQLEVRGQELEARAAEIAALGASLEELRGQLGEADRRAEALSRTIAQRNQHIAALESSLTWRMTRPLRTAANALSRWASLLRLRGR